MKMNLTPPYKITNPLKLTGREAVRNQVFLDSEAKRLTEKGWRIKLEIVKTGKVGFLKRLA